MLLGQTEEEAQMPGSGDDKPHTGSGEPQEVI